MNIKFLGTEYGGWTIDLDSINEGDVIICGGAGEDISFEEELLKYKNITIIEVDPTEKSHIFLESRVNDKIKLIKRAIESEDKITVKMFKNKYSNYVSESVNNNHSYVYEDFHEVGVISIKKLREKYNPSFIKLDIEGSEYNVLEECIGIKQVCVEFHHHCLTDKSFEDTMILVNKFLENNYQIIDNRKNYQELTFILKN
jgi:FkbM family methyltransferase